MPLPEKRPLRDSGPRKSTRFNADASSPLPSLFAEDLPADSPKPFSTIAIDQLTPDTICSALPDHPEYKVKQDLISLYTEYGSSRTQRVVQNYYDQWRKLSHCSMDYFLSLIDGQIEVPKGVRPKKTSNTEAIRAVLSFRQLAVEAQAKGLTDLCVAAHRKVLDYLTLSCIQCAMTGAKVTDRIPQQGDWFKEAVNALSESTPTTSSVPQQHSESTSSGDIASVVGNASSGAQLAEVHRASDTDELTSIVDGFQVQIGDNVPEWRDLVDVDGTKIMLQRAVINPLSCPKAFQDIKRNGVLLYGPPGCGKTVLVHSMVSQCRCNFLAVQLGALMSKEQGHTEKAVGTLITKAKAIQPCIVFIDEVDALARQRYDGVASARSIFLTHWSSLEGTNVIVVGATNMPETIDGAFLRRLDRLIYVGLPEEDARLGLLKTTCGKMRCSLSDHEFEHLAVKSTHGLTCDEIIKEIWDLASLLASEVVSGGYFVKIDASTNGAVYESCPMNTTGAIYLPHELEGRPDVTVQRRPVSFELLEDSFIEKLGFVEADRFAHFDDFKSTHAQPAMLGRDGILLD